MPRNSADNNESMGLHSYYVKYIARGGHVDRRFVMATSAVAAKEKASADGCDDILGARRARFFTRFFISLAVIAAMVVAAVVASVFFS